MANNPRKYKILVAEDERLLRTALVSKLERIESLDIDVSIAHDGKEALELANKINYDLILLDLTMPLLNGEGFLRKYKKDTPVFIVTNNDTYIVNENIQDIRVLDIITKSNITIHEMGYLVENFFSE